MTDGTLRVSLSRSKRFDHAVDLLDGSGQIKDVGHKGE